MLLARAILVSLLFAPLLTLAETQNTISLTASQMLPGDSGAFTSTQASGAAANAAGTLYHTYSGLMKFSLSTATGRYAGLSGTNAYGINVGPFLLFRSFLSSNFLTMVTSSTMCPSATTYNWMGIRYRAPYPLTSSFRQDASSNTFYAGGKLVYDRNGVHQVIGSNMFNLAGPTLNSSPNYYFDGVSSATCATGSLKMLGGGTDSPMDTRGTFFFGDDSFFFLAGGGNPMAAVGVPEQTLTAPGMAAISTSAFSGLYSTFGMTGQSAAQDKKNIIVFPDSAGTTFTLYTANDLDDPSNRTLLGTVDCTSLNSPTNGFCSGTLTLSGVTGTGKAACMVSTQMPQWLLSCTAQYPSDNTIPVTILARVPLKALLSVTLDQSYYSVANAGNSTTITATIRNLSGKAVATMGNPSSGALQLAAPFSNVGAWAGTSGSCGSSLAGFASCTTTITYAPSSVGTSFQTFRVAYDDGYYGTVNATARLIGMAGLSSITVSPATATFSAGSTVQYSATATYNDASTQDVTSAVTWSSNSSSTASISSAGVASFSQTGAVTFTASLGAVNDTQDVTSTSGGTIEVLGQPTPDGIQGALTGMSAPSDAVVAANRLFVVDTSNHRVLIWDSIPSSSDTAADLVLCQDDLESRTANAGGTVAANTCSSPSSIASDGTRLVLADPGNNRVLIWNTLPTTNGQAADVVLGHANFTTATADDDAGAAGLGSNALDNPQGVAIAGTGISAKLIVTDYDNNRVAVWNTFPTSNHASPSIMLGQSAASCNPAANCTSSNRGGTAANNTFANPRGVATDGTRLFITDYTNNRLLVWDTMPTVTGQAADRVIGQPDFVTTTALGTPTQGSLRSPMGVYVSGTYLYVADNQNHRVMIWSTLPTSDGQNANYVLGQTLFTTRTANNGTLSASTLNAPKGVFATASKLYVVDNSNNRLLIWNSIPSANKQAADVVLGQANFTKNEVNSVGLPDSTTLRQPTAISACGTKLFVADSTNHRVLIWNTIPTSNGQAASVVLGQPDFASNTANNGGRTGSTMSTPNGVYCDGTRLFVADTGNHRVLIWNTIPTVNGTAANLVLGQSGLTTGTANQGGISAATLSSPRSVYSTGTKLFVADSSNNRVLVWNSIPSSNKQASDVVIGQPDAVTNTALAPPDATSLRNPYGVHGDGTRLYVADYDNYRVVGWNTLPTTTGQSADIVLGQTDFTTRVADQGGISAATLDRPTGVYADGTSLIIADYINHRVMIHDTYPTGNKEAADRVIGQPTFAASTLNNGGLDANSLYNPRAVYSDTNRVFIADYNNYRVTVVAIKARLSISDGPTYSYGDIVVGNSSIKAFTVTNIGTATAPLMTGGSPALSAPFSYVGGSYPGTAGTCGASLAGSASCTIRVQFNPTTEAATFSDVVRVQFYNGSSTEVAVVGVTGRSVLQASLTFTDGASYGFGTKNIGTGTDKTLTVSNASGVLASLMKQGTPALAAPFSFKDGQYPGTGGTCGTLLATGDTCTLVIRYSPTAAVLSSQTLYLSYYNGSFTTTQSIALTGTGN